VICLTGNATGRGGSLTRALVRREDREVARAAEATTLDEIAAVAGISRRTFFYYFRSKDDILLAHLGGYPEALKEAVLESASAGAPVDVVRDALLKLSIRFESPRTIAKQRREGLRLLAMASLGAMRPAVDAWIEQDGKRPLAKYIQDAFKNLKAEI
jgi:AcrR family transcriptional regulator